MSIESRRQQMILDSEEERKVPEPPERERPYWATVLEMAAVFLLIVALFLRMNDMVNSTTFMRVSGLSALIYLGFSWYMFSFGRFVVSELMLAITAGLIFSFSIIALISKLIQSSYSDELMLAASIVTALLLVAVVGVLLYKSSDNKPTQFYGLLLSRTVFFVVLVNLGAYLFAY